MPKKNYGLNNAAEFLVRHADSCWEEQQFLPRNLKECAFWMQTPLGYKFKKWYAVIGDTVMAIPLAVWTQDELALYGVSIEDYLGSAYIDKISYFMSHEFEVQNGDVVLDIMSQWHVTYDLYTSIEDYLCKK